MLFVVATPIGNLKDITLRAIGTLKSVDLILAEDTRIAKKLLSRFEIGKSVIRYDEYAADKIYLELLKKLEKGEKIALVTDAGTPGISDPGSKLVNFVQKKLPETKIVPVPGASAITAALSVCGLNASRFAFLGYPPHKKGRQKFFKELKEISVRPVVFFESPHRIKKTFLGLKEIFGGDCEIIAARELTKIHEEIFRGVISEAEKHFEGERQKGEFVLAIP